MENQEVNQEKKGIKVIISCNNKKIGIRVEQPNKGIKHILETIKKQARTEPERMWDLPEMDRGGNRIKYMLGRVNASSKIEILDEVNEKDEEMSFIHYNIKEGDELVITHKVIAG